MPGQGQEQQQELGGESPITQAAGASVRNAPYAKTAARQTEFTHAVLRALVRLTSEVPKATTSTDIGSAIGVEHLLPAGHLVYTKPNRWASMVIPHLRRLADDGLAEQIVDGRKHNTLWRVTPAGIAQAARMQVPVSPATDASRPAEPPPPLAVSPAEWAGERAPLVIGLPRAPRPGVLLQLAARTHLLLEDYANAMRGLGDEASEELSTDIYTLNRMAHRLTAMHDGKPLPKE